MVQKNNLFIVPQPRQKPELRLFCLPFAGGSAYAYQGWQQHVGPEVELVLVQLKGRGARIDEMPHQDMHSLVDELMAYSAYLTQCPYLLFGHSMGALSCYALCCELYKQHKTLPVHMIASGCRAPHQAYQQRTLHALPQKEFFYELAQLSGTPQEVLANKELMELFEPLLRADFRIAETYQAEPLKMHFALSVLYGDHDHSVTISQLNAWQELSSKGCTLTQMPGDHFFIRQSANQVLSYIQSLLHEFSRTKPGL